MAGVEAANAMTCPWYISARAVHEYAALRGVRNLPDSGEVWDHYRNDLMGIAEVVDLRAKEDGRAPKRTASGLLSYRFRSKKLRLDIQLHVSNAPRPEGELPQLVSVVAGFRRGR